MGYVLLLGGARSGKSAFACRLAEESGRPVTFVATATAEDAEMAERIERHRISRPAGWRTVEEPRALLGPITTCEREQFVVVDCLTLWVANLQGAGATSSEIGEQATALASALASRDEGVVVSNEVGLGIVPANETAREFRDILGTVNAEFAARAQRAILMVAGRALDLVAPR
ncbi:MAG TPA: bifunctional adenosylcobinamide kinase/adenosylcobinamide-phosphate guanylyltransferase [Kofleriaceae bacterium]|jgi:adenosyl cobinamide kinase/adenosyl cobinamide phosphate guanylyltransferase